MPNSRQLVDEDRARSHISFLQHLQPHPNTIIIVSTLPDEHKADKPNEWLYYYGCQTVLMHNCVKSMNVPLFESKSKEAEAIVKAMLSRKGDSLTPHQWAIVRALTMGEGVTTSALYLNLLVKKVAGWRSYDGVGGLNHAHMLHLNPTVKGLVGQIFEDIEKRYVMQRGVVSVVLSLVSCLLSLVSCLLSLCYHLSLLRLRCDPHSRANLHRTCPIHRYGEKIVRRSLGLLTYAREGISDAEMVDLLSLDDDIVNDVYAFAEAKSSLGGDIGKWRIPAHVWVRIRSELDGMVVTRQGNCLQWYHRQLVETAESRYEDQKARCHRDMGLYFSNLLPEEVVLGRKVQRQHMTRSHDGLVWTVKNISHINRRRVIEGYYHLCAASSLGDASLDLPAMQVCISPYCHSIRPPAPTNSFTASVLTPVPTASIIYLLSHPAHDVGHLQCGAGIRQRTVR